MSNERKPFFALNDNFGTTTLYADLQTILQHIEAHYLHNDFDEEEFKTIELKISPCTLSDEAIDRLPDWEE